MDSKLVYDIIWNNAYHSESFEWNNLKKQIISFLDLWEAMIAKGLFPKNVLTDEGIANMGIMFVERGKKPKMPL